MTTEREPADSVAVPDVGASPTPSADATSPAEGGDAAPAGPSTWSPPAAGVGQPAGLPPVPPVAELPAGSPPDSAAPAAPAPAGPPPSRPGAWRKIAYLFAFLSIIALPVALLTVWSHYLLLNTNGWVGLVGPVAQNEAVIDTVSVRLADQVVGALDIEDRVNEVLPGLGAIVGPAVEDALHRFIAERTATAMESEQFQEIWINANREVHQRVVAVLRGEAENVQIENGQVTINLLPLVALVLQSVEDTLSDVLGRPIDIPFLDVPPEQLVPTLEGALGIDLPDDLGLVTVDAPALQTASTAVRVFDFLSILLPILFLLTTALALALATRRRRMLLVLAVGWAIGALLVIVAAEIVGGIVVAAIAEADVAAAVQAIIQPAFNLARLGATLILVGGLIGAILLLLTGNSGPARRLRAWGDGLLRSGSDGSGAGSAG